MLLLIYRIYSDFSNCPINVFYRIEIFFFLSAANQVSHIALINWVRVKSGWTLRCRTIHRKTNTLWYHLHVESKTKKDKNELIHETETDLQTEENLIVTEGVRGREGIN